VLRGKRKDSIRSAGKSAKNPEESELRIIGGAMRGRKLYATGQERTRPMKDRVREAVFNLLGPDVVGKHVIDLFAGSGALALEALSRQAAGATLVERHLPTAELVRRNAAELGVADRVDVVWADTFVWMAKNPPAAAEPWLVFCSPPYAFYVERQAEMLSLVCLLLERAPAGSVFVVESDLAFDTAVLPGEHEWLVRAYPPAVVAICRK
jgi:16S rRNA (guanine(966)-N(2))-methyltransferase RsmD